VAATTETSRRTLSRPHPAPSRLGLGVSHAAFTETS
jgi:hypothetical protein